MKIFFAPLHLRFQDFGSEIGWAYEFYTGLRRRKDVQVEAIVGSSFAEANDVQGIHNLAMISHYTSSFFWSIRFHSQVWRVSRSLPGFKQADVIHHFLPFSLDRTVSFVALGLPASKKLVIGPIQTRQAWGGSDSLITRVSEALARGPLRWLSTRTLQKASALVAIESTTAAALLERVGGSVPVHIIPPGIHAHAYVATVRSFNPKKGIRFVTVGHLLPHKGVMQCVEAIRCLQQQGYSASLDIVGDGPEMDLIAQNIRAYGLQDRVILHGRVAKQAVAAFYANADAYMSMSAFESWGQVYVEAMATGLPVLAYVNVGSSAIIAEGVSGYLVPERTGEAMAQVAQNLFSSPSLLARLSKGARLQVEDRYDWETVIIPRYVALYESL